MDSPFWIPIAFFFAVAFVAFVMIQARTRREEKRVELHSRILERIGSAREFGEFLDSDPGTRFLKAISPEVTRPEFRMLGALRAGVVLFTVGIGIFLGISVDAFGDGAADFLIVATILTSVGVGLLLSSAASYVVARRLGLMNGQSHAQSPVNRST
jgi:hypothetical protein